MLIKEHPVLDAVYTCIKGIMNTVTGVSMTEYRQAGIMRGNNSGPQFSGRQFRWFLDLVLKPGPTGGHHLDHVGTVRDLFENALLHLLRALGLNGQGPVRVSADCADSRTSREDTRTCEPICVDRISKIKHIRIWRAHVARRCDASVDGAEQPRGTARVCTTRVKRLNMAFVKQMNVGVDEPRQNRAA